MARFDSASARAEDIVRSFQGGVSTNADKWPTDFSIYLLDQIRGVVILEFYGSSKQVRLHNSLMQPYSVTKVTAEQVLHPISQKECSIRFKMPQVLMINDLIDGVGYIGSKDGITNYRRVRTRAELAGLYKHETQSPAAGIYTYALVDVDDFVEIHGADAQKELLINACFSSPTLVPGFNLDNDRYPINDAIMLRAKELASKMQLNQMAQTPEDRIQNFQVELTKLKQQIQIK